SLFDVRRNRRESRPLSPWAGFPEKTHGLAHGHIAPRGAAADTGGRDRLCRWLDHQRPGHARHHPCGLAACAGTVDRLAVVAFAQQGWPLAAMPKACVADDLRVAGLRGDAGFHLLQSLWLAPMG